MEVVAPEGVLPVVAGTGDPEVEVVTEEVAEEAGAVDVDVVTGVFEPPLTGATAGVLELPLAGVSAGTLELPLTGAAPDTAGVLEPPPEGTLELPLTGVTTGTSPLTGTASLAGAMAGIEPETGPTEGLAGQVKPPPPKQVSEQI